MCKHLMALVTCQTDWQENVGAENVDADVLPLYDIMQHVQHNM